MPEIYENCSHNNQFLRGLKLAYLPFQQKDNRINEYIPSSPKLSKKLKYCYNCLNDSISNVENMKYKDQLKRLDQEIKQLNETDFDPWLPLCILGVPLFFIAGYLFIIKFCTNFNLTEDKRKRICYKKSI